MDILSKICFTCKKTKSISDFHVCVHHKDGLASSCKECVHKRRVHPIKIGIEENRKRLFNNGLKICSKCKESKPLNLFPILKQSKDGRACNCKQCKKDFYDLNKDEINKLRRQSPRKQYYTIEKRRELGRLYDKKRQKKHNEYLKLRRKTNPNFKIASNLRRRTNRAIKVQFATKHLRFDNYIGCTIGELRIHIEKQFTEGMTWDKYLNGEIHLDHITPCSKFDLTKTEEQKKCFHYSNLQPLWAEDNHKKSNKMIFKTVA